MFPSRFFIIEDVVKHEELMKVLNTIKKDTDNLAAVSSLGGPTYKTNYYLKNAQSEEILKPIIKQIDKYLIAEGNISIEEVASSWYAEYGEYDFHQPHVHSGECCTEFPNSFRYSGIMSLSNFGETTFINPNSSSFSGPILTIPSAYNRVILFPSNIYHYVLPHGLRDRTRAVFSFNCILKMDT